MLDNEYNCIVDLVTDVVKLYKRPFVSVRMDL